MKREVKELMTSFQPDTQSGPTLRVDDATGGLTPRSNAVVNANIVATSKLLADAREQLRPETEHTADCESKGDSSCAVLSGGYSSSPQDGLFMHGRADTDLATACIALFAATEETMPLLEVRGERVRSLASRKPGALLLRTNKGYLRIVSISCAGTANEALHEPLMLTRVAEKTASMSTSSRGQPPRKIAPLLRFFDVVSSAAFSVALRGATAKDFPEATFALVGIEELPGKPLLHFDWKGDVELSNAVCANLCAATEALTLMGIMHGDIHALNVLVGPDGAVSFVDFEFAGDFESVMPLVGSASHATALQRMMHLNKVPVPEALPESTDAERKARVYATSARDHLSLSIIDWFVERPLSGSRAQEAIGALNLHQTAFTLGALLDDAVDAMARGPTRAALKRVKSMLTDSMFSLARERNADVSLFI